MKKIFLPVSLLILLLTLILPFRCIAQGPPITFGRTDPPINLLNGGNTQWVFCSNSDTNKGISTMTYDAGAAGGGDIPDPGDSGTGGTSGATCKIISVTVSTGAFATNDATGTIEIGASAGRFHDNETVTFTDGETVVVNHPDSAAGVDKVQNGEFSVDTDPPPGWIAGNSATLSTEAGGQVTNCMKILENGADNPEAKQSITVEEGKIYYLSFYHKDIDGTTDNPQWGIYDQTGSAWIKVITTETANAAWTQVTWYFEAPINCVEARIYLRHDASNGDADAYYFDEVSCYEVTPGCTAANNLAFDGHYKDTTLDVYRQHNDTTYTRDGSFYSAKFVPSAANDFYYITSYARRALPEWYQQFAGKTLTAAVGCLTSTASHAFIQIIDSDTTDYDQTSDSSPYHPGDGTWQWLEKTITVSASTTEFSVAFVFDQSAGITYFTMPILVYGSSIGVWNYVPESDKRIYMENDVASQAFNGKTGANGFSDVSATELCLESDSLACIGKGVKAVRVNANVGDSGSAGTDCWFAAGQDLSVLGTEFIISPYGLVNDMKARVVNWIPCNSSGNYEYQIDATGGSTFDINNFLYKGVEWR